MNIKIDIQNDSRDLLSLTFAGSENGGKSTLLSRILPESKKIFQDRITALGEQGITIDATIVLIDAQLGALSQIKQHEFSVSLLVVVNKMDLVDYSEDRYRKIVKEYTAFSEKLNIHEITFIPASALMGDNVAEHGGRMTWYNGPTVIHHLKTVSIAAGMRRESADKSANVVWHKGKVDIAQRALRNRHEPACYWFTGFSGSGKSTLASAFEQKLFTQGKQVYVIDGDNVRHGLNSDLGFTAEDRTENIRRVGHVASLMHDAGFIVLCCFISPTRVLRDYVRGLFPEGAFREVHVKCGLEECIRRDPKGLYKKALAGEIPHFTGVSAPYEEPVGAEYVIETDSMDVDECVKLLEKRPWNSVSNRKITSVTTTGRIPTDNSE